jgi:hypothetical protein
MRLPPATDAGALELTTTMFLKNYTSDAPVHQTIHRIEQVLIKCGVTGITKDYAPDGTVIAVAFKIPAATGDVTIRLPVNEQQAIDALWLDYVDGDVMNKAGTEVTAWGSRKKKRRSDFVEQGKRTAWKIMQDWVEVQMSMIQMKQADTMEVFLPYVWNGKSTIYNRVKDAGFRALLPETTNTVS